MSDCTCGERMRCEIEVDPVADPALPTVGMTLERDEDSFGVCDDCYPGSAVCAVPPLPAAASLWIVAGGHRFQVLTDPSGRLPVAQCWTYSPQDQSFKGPTPAPLAPEALAPPVPRSAGAAR